MNEKITKTNDTVIHEVEHEGQKLQIALSAADLERILASAIKAAKEPDDETKERLATEKKHRQAAMQNMILEAKQAEEAVAARQARCTHKKPDLTTAVHGQVHSDHLIHPICIICQKLFAAYPAPAEMMGATGF